MSFDAYEMPPGDDETRPVLVHFNFGEILTDLVDIPAYSIRRTERISSEQIPSEGTEPEREIVSRDLVFAIDYGLGIAVFSKSESVNREEPADTRAIIRAVFYDLGVDGLRSPFDPYEITDQESLLQAANGIKETLQQQHYSLDAISLVDTLVAEIEGELIGE